MIRPHALATPAFVAAALFLASCGPDSATDDPARPTSGMVPVNDIQMYYEIHGEGAPLMLLHGGLGNTGHWQDQVPALSGHYRVIAVDSRGHGRSTLTEQPISYALMASDVLAFMDYMEIGKAHVLGWSDGGIIGLHLAIHDPERVQKVIAFGASYNPSGVRHDVMENQRFQDYIQSAAGEYQALSPDPTQWDAFMQNIGQMWATEPNFDAEALESITVPVLVLSGADEEAILPEHLQEMAELIPASELLLLPGTGHFANWEKPDAFNAAVLEFLARRD